MVVNKFSNNINNINNINQTNAAKIKSSRNLNNIPGNNNISFQDILKQTAEANKVNKAEKKLSFSKHAQQRLTQRNIALDDELIDKINGALQKAAGKNIRNVLLLSDDTAFIVSVDNNVVVTAMNNDEMKENVITKIDGTVII